MQNTESSILNPPKESGWIQNQLEAAAFLLLGVLMSAVICSTVDAFVALGFANTFGTGSILAFLIFGPMIDIKAVLLFTTTFKRRAVMLIVVLVTLMSFLASIWINLNVG